LGSNFYVNHHIPINKTLPPGEIFVYQKEEMPAAEGMTVFSPMLGQYIELGTNHKVILPAAGAKDGRITELCLPDGSELILGRIIHAVRTKSYEEVIEGRALRVTQASLVTLIIVILIPL
jgi:hypothetical protein